MRIRYAIEKEIEVPDNLTAMDIDDIISQKCEGENGFDYQWMNTSEINEQHLTGLFDGMNLTISYGKFGGNNMKVLGSFVDCVYDSNLYKEDMGDIRTKLISRLPDKRICEMASVLIIDTKYDMYVVKIRRPELNSSGCVDIEKTHKKIYETDFIEISKRDYEGLDWREATKRTDELMKPGSFVIFKTDIEVDKLLD